MFLPISINRYGNRLTTSQYGVTMTLMEDAKKGIVTPSIEAVAKTEDME